MDRGAWWATVHGITKGWTRLSDRAQPHLVLVVKNPPANAGDIPCRNVSGSISGSGRSPGGGHGNPLQYSCLENLHGQRSLAHGVAKRHDLADLAWHRMARHGHGVGSGIPSDDLQSFREFQQIVKVKQQAVIKLGFKSQHFHSKACVSSLCLFFLQVLLAYSCLQCCGSFYCLAK